MPCRLRRWSLLCAALALGCANAPAYEVWVLDQSDSPGTAHGGTLHVFDAAALNGAAPSARQTIDLSAAASALCQQRTGALPVRPHMVRFNHEQTHAIIAFVASGHVLFLDAATGNPIECLRTSRSPTGQQAHAAYPSPDGRHVLIANQNGKRLERIVADYEANTFRYDSAALLDLATCSTPRGAPCESPDTRPDNAPICPFISNGGLAFVTLRGGGLLVVDMRDSPMRIIAEYDSARVKGNGCGGVQVGDHMYLNAGGRPGKIEHMQLYGFELYRFDLRGFAAAADSAPTPAVLWRAQGQHDSHGMVATPNNRYVWVFDRHADDAQIFDAPSGKHVGTVPLNGELTANAAPDIAAVSPAGDRIFVALRGPSPLSGDPHNATGSTPGLAVIEVGRGGRTGRLRSIVRLSSVHNGVERADPHSVAVRVPPGN